MLAVVIRIESVAIVRRGAFALERQSFEPAWLTGQIRAALLNLCQLQRDGGLG